MRASRLRQKVTPAAHTSCPPTGTSDPVPGGSGPSPGPARAASSAPGGPPSSPSTVSPAGSSSRGPASAGPRASRSPAPVRTRHKATPLSLRMSAPLAGVDLAAYFGRRRHTHGRVVASAVGRTERAEGPGCVRRHSRAVTWVTARPARGVLCCERCGFGGRRSRMSDFGWGLVLLGAYVLLVVLARWLYIARTNVVWSDAQSRAMAKRLNLQVARDPSRNSRAPLTKDDLQQLVEQIEKESPQSMLSGLIGWNGSHQIAQWVLIHEAERLLLPLLGHEELVARMERALGQLDELPQPRREAWEDVIHTLLAAKDDGGHERLNRVYQAYLDELL